MLLKWMAGLFPVGHTEVGLCYSILRLPCRLVIVNIRVATQFKLTNC